MADRSAATDPNTNMTPVRLGAAGLGRAFVLTAPSLRRDPRVELVACAAPRATSRDAFVAEFGGTAHETVERLAADPEVEAIYVATPHEMHRRHVAAALRGGKHVLVEKPLAVTLRDALAIADDAQAAERHVIVGPSHSFDPPVMEAARLIRSGEFGAVRMIHAFNYTDFLYRPRRPEELVTAEGGGVLFSQAVHQIDVVRLLAGGMGASVRAAVGRWDGARPTESAYSAFMAFEGGAFASLTYSGHAHFDSDEFMGWVGELGGDKDATAYGGARRALEGVVSPEEEAALKSTRTYGGATEPPMPAHNEHFGPVVVSCDRADLRLTPDGIWIYGDGERRFHAVPLPDAPRRPVIDALVAAVRDGTPPIQDARWGAASLEVVHAILESADRGREVGLKYQVPAR